MNKKGQTFMISLLTGIMIFLFGIVFINFISPDLTTARTQLQCTTPTISDGAKLTCLFTDTAVIYFIALILSITAGVVLERVLI